MNYKSQKNLYKLYKIYYIIFVISYQRIIFSQIALNKCLKNKSFHYIQCYQTFKIKFQIMNNTSMNNIKCD